MGQIQWALGCALFLALAIGEHADAQEADRDPFAATSEPGRLGAGTPRARIDNAKQRIEQVLNQPLKEPLDFVEQPLRDVMSIISETYDIPVLFDVAALDAVAASPDVEASIQINNITLRSALALMLNNVGAEPLTYVVDNEVLLITTPQEAESRLEVKVYRVDDLHYQIPEPPGASAWAKYDSLVGVISSCVERESWMESGRGEGEIHPHGRDLLVITQTSRVHEQIQQLLDEMRHARAAIRADAEKESSVLASRPVTKGIDITDAVNTNTEKERELIRDLIKKSVD